MSNQSHSESAKVKQLEDDLRRDRGQISNFEVEKRSLSNQKYLKRIAYLFVYTLE